MFFTDYVWINGRPKGRSERLDESSDALAYKIVKDPYGKRISLERFQSGKFLDCLYDSHLFDFRVLCSKVDSSWQKIDTGSITEPSSWIIDHDDRTIAKEIYHFDKELCTECHIYYPQGPLVAKQKMAYQGKENFLCAIALFDISNHPAGLKIFAPDGSGACIFESWDMSDELVQEQLFLLFKYSP